MIFFHFNFLQANLKGGKGGSFMFGPGQHLALLRHDKVSSQVALRKRLASG